MDPSETGNHALLMSGTHEDELKLAVSPLKMTEDQRSSPPQEPITPLLDTPSPCPVSNDSSKQEPVASFPVSSEVDSFHEACANLKIAPPKHQNGASMGLDELIELMFDDGIGHELIMQDDNKKILLFLYGRGFFENDTERRKRVITRFLNPRYSPGLERLLSVIHTDHDRVEPLDASEDINQYCSRWLDLLEKNGYMGGTKREGALTIFELHKLTPVFRRQFLSNCFLHAPAVAHCYLLQIGTGRYDGMMDLAEFVRHNLTDHELTMYTLLDLGGVAVEIFARILKRARHEIFFPQTIEKDLIKKVTDEPEIRHYLAKYGPALVTEFSVDKNFLTQNESGRKTGGLPSFSGTIDSENVFGQHAMVLVGMARVDGKWTLLLQNWWKEMQFLEVTAEYLVSSGAKLVWAKSRQTSMVANFPVSEAIFAETHVDGCDREPPLFPQALPYLEGYL